VVVVVGNGFKVAPTFLRALHVFKGETSNPKPLDQAGSTVDELSNPWLSEVELVVSFLTADEVPEKMGSCMGFLSLCSTGNRLVRRLSKALSLRSDYVYPGTGGEAIEGASMEGFLGFSTKGAVSERFVVETPTGRESKGEIVEALKQGDKEEERVVFRC
jgi:hypothetical protein